MKFEEMINTIQLGDSYELIKNIPDKSIDLMIIDPPYEMETRGAGFHKKRDYYDLIHDKGLAKSIDENILLQFERIMKKTNIYIFCNKNQLPINNYESSSKLFQTTVNKSDKEKYNHPTIKPLPIIKTLIKNSSKENDIVLDCFCGSGTTCVAAKETGRRYIGMEIDPEYHKIAVDRLNGINANGQTSIFTDFDNL